MIHASGFAKNGLKSKVAIAVLPSVKLVCIKFDLAVAITALLG